MSEFNFVSLRQVGGSPEDTELPAGNQIGKFGATTGSELLEKMKRGSNMTKAERIAEVQQSTYEDLLRILEETHLCNVERPTGFGKTELFMRLAIELSGHKFLYVYDTRTTLDNLRRYKVENVDFVSYAGLSIKKREESNKALLLESGYEYVIFDESHLMGGENIKELLTACIPEMVKRGCYVMGGTATPLRTDLVDVTDTFFNGNTTYKYDLEDAFNDGIFEEPLYTVMWYNTKRMQEVLDEVSAGSFATKKLKQLEHAYAKRIGASVVYREKVLQVFGEIPDYMQFICYYPTIQSIRDNEKEVISDFEQAFPERDVNVFRISSAYDHTDGYEDISCEKKPGTIDLVLCVDMLNQGYHSENLTGIVMNRSTLSNIVFTQQVGRCLNINSDKRTIVFDNVANYYVDPLAALASVKELDEEQAVAQGAYSGGSGFRRLTFKVDSEDLEIAEWCRRLIEVKSITDVMLEKAKRAYNQFSAPLEVIEKRLGIPIWVLKEELGLTE